MMSNRPAAPALQKCVALLTVVTCLFWLTACSGFSTPASGGTAPGGGTQPSGSGSNPAPSLNIAATLPSGVVGAAYNAPLKVSSDTSQHSRELQFCRHRLRLHRTLETATAADSSFKRDRQRWKRKRRLSDAIFFKPATERRLGHLWPGAA